MHKTIWLEALRRHVLAIKIGNFPKGPIKETPRIIKKRTKKNDFKNNIDRKDIIAISMMGATIANDVTPVGVMFKWQILMDSCNSSAFFLSGFILTKFSKKLHK